MLDYTKLMYLLYIRKYKTFTKAAEALHITQPSLSIAIKTLEQEYGVTLVNRTTKTVSLTPIGEEIADLAEQGFEYFNKIELLLNSDYNESAETITIHCNNNLFEGVFTNFSDYLGKHANQKTLINIIPLDENKSLDEVLMQYPDDYVLTIVPENYKIANQFQAVHLTQSKAYLGVSKNTTRFLYKSVSLQDLIDIPLISPQKKYGFQQYWMEKLEKIGTPKIVYSSPDAKSVNMLVNKDLGAVFYLDFEHFSQKSNLHLIPIKKSPVFYAILLCSAIKEPTEINFIKSVLLHSK